MTDPIEKLDPQSDIQLIMGLGNPGPQYRLNRHNIGIWCLNDLNQSIDGELSSLAYQAKFQSFYLKKKNIILAHPSTYMNNSGQAVQAILKYFKLAPAQLLILHDDLDLAIGQTRLKYSGGHGGHNGLRSIIQKIGADFYRLRLGIGHPGIKNLVSDYVLSNPSLSEQILLKNQILQTVPIILNWIDHTLTLQQAQQNISNLNQN